MNKIDTKIKYPITKDQLQKGFNIVNEIIVNEKKQYLEKYINEKLELISGEIIKRTINEKAYNELKSNNKKKNVIGIIEVGIKDIINDIQKFKFEFKETNIGQKNSFGSFSNELNVDFYKHISSIWNMQYKIQNLPYQYFKYEHYQVQYRLSDYQNSMPIIKPLSENEIDEIKLKIFEGLKERFPDCLIQIDPLKTYIIIDWN